MIAIIDFIISIGIYILRTLVSIGVSFFTGVIRVFLSSRQEKTTFFTILVIFSLDIYIVSPVVAHNLIYWMIHPFIILAPITHLVRLGGESI